MFIGVIFQQMYNIADSVIAGKFAGENALAAVGASYPITMLFMAVAMGSQIGCSVVVSQFFGAKKYSQMKTVVYTAFITGVIVSASLTIVGLLLSKKALFLLNTPGNILADGDLYLKIYIGGFIFLYLYNVATGVFNSLGDSKTPLYFLICSSVGNVFLDWFFVAVLHMGVAGVAWATFLAQGIACVCSLFFLQRRLKLVKTEGKIELFSAEMLKKLTEIAIPSILQQSFISVGNLFVQQLINSYGSSVIAGYSAAIKLNTFAITSYGTLGNGVSSFTAQNMGAGKTDRVKEGCRIGNLFALGIAVLFFIAYFVFGKTFLGLFMNANSTEMAMKTGYDFLRIVSPFYFTVCIKLVCDGVLRGSSSMNLFMIATFADLILRVILAYILSNFWGETGIWMSWPIGWVVGMILSLIFYEGGMWKKKLSTAC